MKRRELERLETIKRLNAAKARMEVYDQDSDSDIKELLQAFDPKIKKSPPCSKMPSSLHLSQAQPAKSVQPATDKHHEDTMLLKKL